MSPGPHERKLLSVSALSMLITLRSSPGWKMHNISNENDRSRNLVAWNGLSCARKVDFARIELGGKSFSSRMFEDAVLGLYCDPNFARALSALCRRLASGF